MGKICETCGSEFAGRARSKYCSRVCANGRDGRPSRAGRTCEVCGAQYRANYAPQRACSRECGATLQSRLAAERRAARPAPPVRTYTCAGCGRTRRSDDGQRWLKWCSYGCQVRGIGDRVKGLYRMAAQSGAKGAAWRQMLVGYLRERDGDRCSICNKPIRFDLAAGPRGDDRGPSIDHVIPRSQGGSDDLANLRLAHWGCNRNRGNRGGSEQLALVG